MFVVFEGIDGSGKTTLSNRVREELEARGVKLKHLRESGKFASRVTEAIRSLGRDSRNLELTPEAEFLLYVARDVQLIEESLKPALEQVELILADRYLYTAENLGRYGRGLSERFMRPILDVAAGAVQPDLVVLVDVEPALARARRQSHKLTHPEDKPPSRKGLSGTGLQRRLRAGYLEFASREPERWVVVDNCGTLEDSVQRVVRLIETARASGVALALGQYRAEASARTEQSLPGAVGALDGAHRMRSPGERFFEWVDARSKTEPAVAAWMLGGLAGPGVDERREQLAELAPAAVLAGLTGLTDAASWRLRERLLDVHPEAALATLKGIPEDPMSVPWFVPLAHRFGGVALRVLSGSDGEFAWQLRQQLYGNDPSAVLGSLVGLDNPSAWALRMDWLSREPKAASGAREAWARALARSVKGVAGERAHELRERAFEEAPVAVLESLLGVDDPRSWQWRAKYLVRAPKAVMNSLAAIESPRAYALRLEIVETCREALEGLKHSRSDAAFELRERGADSWPSTTIKSLGCAFGTPRGRALYERVMVRSSHDLSLLKHATALTRELVSCRCSNPLDDATPERAVE